MPKKKAKDPRPEDNAEATEATAGPPPEDAPKDADANEAVEAGTETDGGEKETETETGADDGAAPDAEDGAGSEEPAEVDAEEAADPAERAAQLEAERDDLNDKLLRALAEAENVRRRAARDREDASKYAIANFAREMLTVADNLKRAMSSVEGEDGGGEDALKNIVTGLEMTEREMLASLERVGIKTLNPVGERFDPNLHEAMFELDDAAKPAGTVMRVLETGYVLNDRLLRPAKVGVTRGGPKEAPAAADEEAGDSAAVAGGQQAYESKGEEPGAKLDEEL